MRNGTDGRGVFAGEPIAEGALIERFPDRSSVRADQRGHLCPADRTDLDIGESGGVDDLFNDSCDPNAGVMIAGKSAELRSHPEHQHGRYSPSIIPRAR